MPSLAGISVLHVDNDYSCLGWIKAQTLWSRDWSYGFRDISSVPMIGGVVDSIQEVMTDMSGDF
jgi:hypothetical protein